MLPYCKFCITRKTLCSKYCRFMVIRNEKKNKYLLGRKYRHLISMFHWFAPTQLFRENAKSGFITDENYCKLMIDREIWCFGGGRNMVENPSEFTLSFSFTLQQIEEQVHTDWTVLPHNTLSISSLRACVYLCTSIKPLVCTVWIVRARKWRDYLFIKYTSFIFTC